MSYTLEDFNRFKMSELKPSDTFKFDCSMCGSCCRKRSEPIVLTGTDIFRIAKSLNEKIEDVVMKNMRTYIGEDFHVPVIVLNERMDGSCRFLRKGKCIIQNDKPVSCAIFPLGRYFEVRDHSFHYFMNSPCSNGNKNVEYTLQEWLDKFHIKETESMTIAWNRLLAGITAVTNKISKEEIKGEFLYDLFSLLYFGYETDKPYIEQVEQNMERAKEIFKHKFNTVLTF